MADPTQPSPNQLPDPALFESSAPKKKRKQRALEDPSPLTMNSLLDIMTIILVFLLKSYSTDPVQLKAAPDLKPPFSTSELRPQLSSTVTVTLNNILVNDNPVLGLDAGKIPDGEVESDGFLISPLYRSLTDAVEHQKKVAKYRSDRDFNDVITIIADRHVPFSLLSQVMYTAGQATFSKFKFMVVKGGD